MTPPQILGIDIGGSGLKAALVDTHTGRLLTERVRRETPAKGKPEELLAEIATIINDFAWAGPVGCGFPGVIEHGRVLTAANLDKSWIGRDLQLDLTHLGASMASVLNDADAAGFAELHVRPKEVQRGSHLFLTVGTGVGSAWLQDGILTPNTEFGHLLFQPSESRKAVEIEDWISKTARKAAKLDWEGWAERCNEVLRALHRWFYCDSFILGGGITKRWDRFEKVLSAPVPVLASQLGNDAGVIGSALFAASQSAKTEKTSEQITLKVPAPS